MISPAIFWGARDIGPPVRSRRGVQERWLARSVRVKDNEQSHSGRVIASAAFHDSGAPYYDFGGACSGGPMAFVAEHKPGGGIPGECGQTEAWAEPCIRFGRLLLGPGWLVVGWS